LELQRRIEVEGSKNVEISTTIKDLEAKIRIREDTIVSLRKEMEGARYSNSALLDNNANLQQELEALNQHIRVLTQ
jgi:FtsZ-binding cell division protein ZapB